RPLHRPFRGPGMARLAILLPLHRLRRPEPLPVRLHELVPDDVDPAQGGSAGVILLAAAVAATLTLREAVAEALAKAPPAAAARARGDAARARLSEARAMWLPRVDVTETAARSDDPVFVFAGLLQQGRFGADVSPLQSFRAGLNVRYTIFDQLRRFEANAMAKNGVAP